MVTLTSDSPFSEASWREASGRTLFAFGWHCSASPGLLASRSPLWRSAPWPRHREETAQGANLCHSAIWWPPHQSRWEPWFKPTQQNEYFGEKNELKRQKSSFMGIGTEEWVLNLWEEAWIMVKNAVKIQHTTTNLPNVPSVHPENHFWAFFVCLPSLNFTKMPTYPIYTNKSFNSCCGCW